MFNPLESCGTLVFLVGVWPGDLSGPDAAGWWRTTSWAEARERLHERLPHTVVVGTQQAPGPVLEELRAVPRLWGTHVIVLVSQRSDVLRALELGADDAVLTPVEPRELALRAEVGFKRRGAGAAESIRLDTLGHRAFVADREVPLTPLEFALLRTFLEEPRHVFTRQELMHIIKGERATGTSRTLDNHVMRLRAKLGPLGSLIESVRGRGYCLQG